MKDPRLGLTEGLSSLVVVTTIVLDCGLVQRNPLMTRERWSQSSSSSLSVSSLCLLPREFALDWTFEVVREVCVGAGMR